MKKFTVCTLIICMLLMSLSVCSFASEAFSVDYSVNFDTSVLTVTINTPAQYEQNILVTVYPKDAEVTLPAQYVRLGTTRANADGEASITFNLSNVSKGYYTVSATGGGSMAGTSHATVSFYFETTTETNTVTVPAISAATGTDLVNFMERLEDDYGLDMGEGYSSDSTAFIKYFEAIREDDYDNNFTSMADVQATIDGANLIITTLGDATSEELMALYEAKCEALSLFDIDDADYAANKEEVYPLLKEVVKAFVPTGGVASGVRHLTDIRTCFMQAQGLVTINASAPETVGAAVEKYGASYGIDVDKYLEYCADEENATLINLNLTVGTFRTGTQVLAAYNSAVKEIEGDSGEGGSGGSGGGGGGSFGGGRPATDLKGEGETETDRVPEEPTLPEVSFKDITDSHWASEYIIKLAQYGVIGGFEDGTYRPEDLVTKEQFVKMVVEAFGIKSDKTTTSFADVSASHWANEYIAIAVGKGIINGKSETEFGIGENLSRQDAATIIIRVADMAGYKLPATASVSFADNGEISDYAKDGVTRLSAAGVLSGMGDGTFKPLGNLTRAQAAKILYMMITSK